MSLVLVAVLWVLALGAAVWMLSRPSAVGRRLPPPADHPWGGAIGPWGGAIGPWGGANGLRRRAPTDSTRTGAAP